eukprot:Selendium_serpulae@DN5119_c0_g1_i1.p1
MATIRRVIANLLHPQSTQKFLCVCLGFQHLGDALGFNVVRKPQPQQGRQLCISLFGERQLVGFYNSFSVQFCEEVPIPRGVELSYDPNSRDLWAVRGERYAGFQFHPESILTQNGFQIVTAALEHVLGCSKKPSTEKRKN